VIRVRRQDPGESESRSRRTAAPRRHVLITYGAPIQRAYCAAAYIEPIASFLIEVKSLIAQRTVDEWPKLGLARCVAEFMQRAGDACGTV
jgi:hypothetical protein